MRTLKYLFKRFIILYYLLVNKKYKIYQNLYYIKKNTQNKSVLFYFADPLLMHLGDHLFFEPICRLFKENGLNVVVEPASTMVNYFKVNNYEIGTNSKFNSFDLVITSSRFMHVFSKCKNSNILYIRTESSNVTGPLINDLINKICSIFNLIHKVNAKPLYFNDELVLNSTLGLNLNEKYIIFNNYIDSGSFRVFGSQFSKLESYARKFKRKNPDFIFIHLGSKRDLLKDSKSYDFIDIDLRGKTSLYDLFVISKHPSVICYIGFDTFIMHLFFILDKDVHVLQRGRLSKKSEEYVDKYILPPFESDKKNKITIY